ncbi:hypothetical protein EV126DRAFT_32367 [Verticillium dahliae]|nr:hypothetical protein EV126DRAFT_32367 [Verticillium dahliae]
MIQLLWPPVRVCRALLHCTSVMLHFINCTCPACLASRGLVFSFLGSFHTPCFSRHSFFDWSLEPLVSLHIVPGQENQEKPYRISILYQVACRLHSLLFFFSSSSRHSFKDSSVLLPASFLPTTETQKRLVSSSVS